MSSQPTDTSTQEAENQQAVANVLWLAELECPSPCKDGMNTLTVFSDKQSTYPCHACQGTGVKYPQLRLPVDTPWCQGWRPVSQETAGTEARKLPEFWHLMRHEGKKLFHCVFQSRDGPLFTEMAQDPDNATIAALMKMEEAR